MSAYAKLPGLLRRIDALESGAQLCRRRDCYGRTGLFTSGPWCGFCSARFALMVDIRMSTYFTAHTSSLNPFIRISSAC